MSDLASARARLRRLVLVSGWLLIALCIGWEWRWAPLRAGGSLLVLKAAPLLALLPAMARDRPKAYQWTTLVILLYACEGMVRATSEASPVRELAALELVLALAIYVAAIRWLRVGRPARGGRKGAATTTVTVKATEKAREKATAAPTADGAPARAPADQVPRNVADDTQAPDRGRG